MLSVEFFVYFLFFMALSSGLYLLSSKRQVRIYVYKSVTFSFSLLLAFEIYQDRWSLRPWTLLKTEIHAAKHLNKHNFHVNTLLNQLREALPASNLIGYLILNLTSFASFKKFYAFTLIQAYPILLLGSINSDLARLCF